MAERRAVYAIYSPVFWRPRPGVTALHAGFLARQAHDPTNIALRTRHGFIIVQRRGREGLVDDFAVDAGDRWVTDGETLLTEAWRRLRPDGITTMRVVTAQADRPKVQMLIRCGLTLVEQWWVQPVNPASAPKVQPGRVHRAGFSGLLGPAPPVYDPGGPVLLVDRIDPDACSDHIADTAAEMGAVLAIVPAEPSSTLARELDVGEWSVASEWYLGQPTRSRISDRAPRSCSGLPDHPSRSQASSDAA